MYYQIRPTVERAVFSAESIFEANLRLKLYAASIPKLDIFIGIPKHKAAELNGFVIISL